jgi:hypothetical protein
MRLSLSSPLSLLLAILLVLSNTVPVTLAFSSRSNDIMLRSKPHQAPPSVAPARMPMTKNTNEDVGDRQTKVEQERNEWISRSVEYYSKVMREQRRRNIGQVQTVDWNSVEYKDDFHQLAKKHYFALRKIKSGQNRHAEIIYRRIIHELMREDDHHHCDHAKLAVTTLLLALHMQRMGYVKQTRSVFLNFFRVVVLQSDSETQCACSAKVLGAYALFEMKQGHPIKSLEIARRAVQFDPSLEPVLHWKKFRDVVHPPPHAQVFGTTKSHV